ncbi:MAG: nickel pincer cofactor biosynthesis protein LarB [Candidatus Omnitrophota bacterium]|nr:nickel pincer cofactor biosynthesis protein LarB [Candidatus Omnitrophota bacterium]
MTFTQKAIERILKEVRERVISEKEAFARLKNLPYEDLSFARIDHHRSFRKGMPEAVYAPGKSVEQLDKIIRLFQKSGQQLIVTRLKPEVYAKLKKKLPRLKYSRHGCIGHFAIPKKKMIFREPAVAVITAGTSDVPVAEEAVITLESTGRRAERFYDCGVAGLHRLLDQLPEIKRCGVIICVAGMEGALVSVVAGLVDKPVIAVPTSVGYGAHFRGLAPLLSMMNSCAQGVAVVNIDNGFGAACFASLTLASQSFKAAT